MSESNEALGLVETKGFTGMVEASDAMAVGECAFWAMRRSVPSGHDPVPGEVGGPGHDAAPRRKRYELVVVVIPRPHDDLEKYLDRISINVRPEGPRFDVLTRDDQRQWFARPSRVTSIGRPPASVGAGAAGARWPGRSSRNTT